jgi:hypothetical protein
MISCGDASHEPPLSALALRRSRVTLELKLLLLGALLPKHSIATTLRPTVGK